ncbi:MAG: hypothetical protein K8F91_02560 [Candidatus Obscuribacterales bacterium]|nr:hypothetical protein [Candidatus Obscuribacterales bacterium]
MANAKEIEKRTFELLSNEDGKRAFVHSLFQGLAPEDLSILSNRLLTPLPEMADDAIEFNNRIGIQKYSDDERIALEITSLLQFFAYRKRLLESTLTASQVAVMMGVSRQTPHDRAKSGHLLGILDNNVLKFPTWQFDPNGPNGVVDGLLEVLAALECSTIAKISWLTNPNEVFDGLKPIEMLKLGQKDEVLYEARAAGVN